MNENVNALEVVVLIGSLAEEKENEESEPSASEVELDAKLNVGVDKDWETEKSNEAEAVVAAFCAAIAPWSRLLELANYDFSWKRQAKKRSRNLSNA